MSVRRCCCYVMCVALTVVPAVLWAEPLPLQLERVRPSWGHAEAPSRVSQIALPGDPERPGIHLQGHSPTSDRNHYFGFMYTLSEPVDLTDLRLSFLARTGTLPATRAFYVRCYNRGEREPAWSFQSWNGVLGDTWQAFSIQTGLSDGGLNWEPRVVGDRDATDIDRIEFIVGTSEDDCGVDAVVAALEALPRHRGVEELDVLPELQHETSLVATPNVPVLVLHPGEPGFAACADRLADAIAESCGTRPDVRPATAEDRVPASTAVLLGHVANNPAMQLLYARKQCMADRLCPGEGGYILRTLMGPLVRGRNVVLVEASDAEGARRGVEALARHIRASEAVLPFLFEARYADAFLHHYPWADDPPRPNRVDEGLARGRQVLASGRHKSVAGILGTVATRYRLTGHAEEARLFVALWQLYADSAVENPRAFGGPWGFDSDFASQDVVPGWDLIEDHPSLSMAERLATLRHLARWLREAVIPSCVGGARGTGVPHNHQTFPALGALYAGLYLTRDVDVLEGDRYLGIADGLFRRQAGFYKPLEDCNGYQWLTNGHLFQYAVARPDPRVFENGNGHRIIDYCLGTMDNLGCQVPYGDTGPWRCWSSEVYLLDVAALAASDGAAAWAASHKRSLRGLKPMLNAFAAPHEAPPPRGFDGVRVWPLDPAYVRTHRAEPIKTHGDRIDKVSFRGGWGDNDAYLLLDAVGNGGHGHRDANSIPRMMLNGRIWLADNDYYKASPQYHNTAVVLREAQSSPMPSYAHLVGHGDTGGVAYSLTRLADYAGVDWDRAVVWLKQTDTFVILDRFTARTSGRFRFRLLWHGVGEPTAARDGMALRQQGASLQIHVTGADRCAVTADPELGENWEGYPYAAPMVHTLKADATRPLDAGDTHEMVTVFRGEAFADPVPWTVASYPDGRAAVIDAGGTLVGAALGPLRLTTPDSGFETDAHVVLAAGDEVVLLGATRAAAGADVLHASAQPRSVVLPGLDPQSFLAGLPVVPPSVASLHTRVPESVTPLAAAVPVPREAVLSGNAGAVGRSSGAVFSSEPAPADHNVLGPQHPNRLGALIDGKWDRVQDCVAFDPDVPVRVRVDLGGVCRLAEVAWLQWWAGRSSRNTAYKLAEARVVVSNDGFAGDERLLGVPEIDEEYPDWGDPVRFSVQGDVEARWVELRLQPRPGTAIYLAELTVRGLPGEGMPKPAAYRVRKLAAFPEADGRSGLVAGTAEGVVLRFGTAGRETWRRALPGQVRDLTVADLDRDGSAEILAAMREGGVRVLAADGTERWSAQLEQYRREPYANVVRAGDLDGDGRAEVVVGGENWRFHAFSPGGDLLWHYEAVHPARSGAVADLDGDGKAEVVCGTHYYYFNVLDAAGHRRWNARFGPICYDVATGRDTLGGARWVACGGGDGRIHGFRAGGERFMQINTGDEVRCVVPTDLDGDGRDEILAGSANGFVYALSADGEVLWTREMRGAVSALAADPSGGRILVGSAVGELALLTGDGEAAGGMEMGAPVIDMVMWPKRAAVCTESGGILWFDTR